MMTFAAAEKAPSTVPVASHHDFPAPDRSHWQALDATLREEWDKNVTQATEKEVRADLSGQLLYLPFPYIGPTGPGQVFGYMFAWDTDFVSRALLVHGRLELVRCYILNYCSMIDRFGYMPNANVRAYSTRSQTPLIADTVWRYYQASRDRDFLYQVYPRLKRNYQEYWTAVHHQTPTGLATNRDLGDPGLPAELASEAETGLDWTPIFGGDVRRCVPLITNCALVRYAKALARIAKEVGRADEASTFEQEAKRRSALIRQYCWNEGARFFFEYDYVAGRQLPFYSDCAYWTLWAGVATREQARALVRNLFRLEQRFGLSCTDKAYPLPSAVDIYGPTCRVTPDGSAISVEKDTPIQGVGGTEPLQWMYPAGWAPTQLIPIEGLDAYGYSAEGQRIASRFLALLLDQHAKTGHLWEKYNVVEGSITLPNARCGNLWMQGWTAAAVVLLGRRVFDGQTL